MKKTLSLLLMISLIMPLCACGDDDTENVEMFRTEVEEAKELGFTATLRAEYADKTAEFELSYLENDDGVKVSVLRPEIISGISANIKADTAELEYDGAILDIGTLSSNGLCPMSALPLTVMAIRDAHIDSVWTEDDMTVMRLVPSDDTEITLWLDKDRIPCNAEISCDGVTVVFIEFNSWEMN